MRSLENHATRQGVPSLQSQITHASGPSVPKTSRETTLPSSVCESNYRGTHSLLATHNPTFRCNRFAALFARTREREIGTVSFRCLSRNEGQVWRSGVR